MTYLIQFTRQFTGVKEGPSEFSTGPLVVEDANVYMVNKIIARSFDESPEIKGAMVYSLERTNEKTRTLPVQAALLRQELRLQRRQA